MKNKFYIIVIAVLLSVVFLQYVFKPKPIEPDYSNWIEIGGEKYKELSSKVTIKWKDTTIYKTHYIPSKPEIVEVPIPVDVDTTAILQDYFAKYFYSDIVPLDTIGTIRINDTISRNKIISRSFVLDYKIPLIKETIIVESNSISQLYIGGGINLDETDIFNSAYAGLLYKTKKDKVFGVNIGINNASGFAKPYIGGSMYWKIRLKKK